MKTPQSTYFETHGLNGKKYDETVVLLLYSSRDAQRDAPIKRNNSRPSFVEFALSAMGRNFHETISKQGI